MADYKQIKISGGDTSAPENLTKRLELMRPFIKSNSDKLLDCGCGRGEYAYAIGSLFEIESYGIEYSFDKASAGLSSLTSANRVICGDIQLLPFADESFDIVLLNEVLEHVPDETTSLNEIFRVLKKDGTLIIFSPNRLYPFESHGIEIKKSRKMLPVYTPFIPYIPISVGNIFFNYIARNYFPSELKSIVKQHGFSVIHHEYVWQTFENISGNQPWVIQKFVPILRKIANILERTILLKKLGLSQMLVAKKTP